MIAALAVLSLSTALPLHEADCPNCKLPLVQNNDDFDNEVVVRYGNKRIEYRSLYCVIKDQDRYKVDLTVYAPGEKVAEPVILKRLQGKWSAPEKAVFTIGTAKMSLCAQQSRAFATVEGLETVREKLQLGDAKGLSLAEFIDAVKKHKFEEKGGSCCQTAAGRTP